MIKVAMIGFGGIAQIHRYAYWLLSKAGVPVRLVAACDRDPEKFKTVTRINLPLGEITNEEPFRAYFDMEEMLAKEEVDLVDICLPTQFHADNSIALLNRGYSVLCEKPMAPSYEDCKRMLKAAEGRPNQLMIGQCVRFYREYEYLKRLVDSGIYGPVRSSAFYRYSPPPFWSRDNWQMDVNKSGGCLVELGIHDVDYVRFLFGEPQTISCRMESNVVEHDHVVSTLHYPELPVVVHSGWVTPEEPFEYGFTVEFEQATVKMHCGDITVAERNGEEKTVHIPLRDGIIGEIEYFVNLLEQKEENWKNPPESSARTILMLEKLKESAAHDSQMLQWEEILSE